MTEPVSETTELTATPTSPAIAWGRLGVLVVGYIGIYLCRKNFAVANPLIGSALHLDKEQIGVVASYSTAAYMVGKFTFGPIIDRVGGRAAFLLSLAAVAVFGALGGLANSLAVLTLLYSLNRLGGSAGWGGMVKQVPDWFPIRSMSLAMGILSLSFVFGGVFATLLAGGIAAWSGNDWRWVMSGPSIVLALILVVCWAALPRGPAHAEPGAGSGRRVSFDWQRVTTVVAARRFWIVCALSFTLTLLRETFNVWTVDFFKTTGGTAMSSSIAAFLSTPFDALGAVGIASLGWVFGRIGQRARMSLLFSILITLAAMIALLPQAATRSIALATTLVGAIGFLSYGPYSLLAGVLAVEIRGKDYVATAAGILDGVGYLAAILSGQAFGRMLDVGGYSLAFSWLAGLAAVSAVLCLFLYERTRSSQRILQPKSAWTTAT